MLTSQIRLYFSDVSKLHCEIKFDLITGDVSFTAYKMDQLISRHHYMSTERMESSTLPKVASSVPTNPHQ
jgi:hypothetical protein